MLAFATPAYAQTGRAAPTWARDLVAADIAETTGGRGTLGGLAFGVRATIAPNDGGVARVIRVEPEGEAAKLVLRRFTGHPRTGWWLWGPDTPTVRTLNAAQRARIEVLAQAAASGVGEGSEASCPTGSQAYVEIAVGGRTTSTSRSCIGNDAVGQLAQALSEIAGSRNEGELFAAAAQELMDVDRAFAAAADSEGVPAAFAQFAARDGMIVESTGAPARGRTAIASRFARWPSGAKLLWSPEMGKVSNRGDMGWTWGNSTYVAADGSRTPGRYISVWTRDFDGSWKYAFDAAIQ
ncbi:MAG: hypothetical protein JNJ73_02970 [Hyphomonadaceae bacterium]|nr:hypothetical protein [Hyphomonadaceae bacterium]